MYVVCGRDVISCQLGLLRLVGRVGYLLPRLSRFVSSVQHCLDSVRGRLFLRLGGS